MLYNNKKEKYKQAKLNPNPWSHKTHTWLDITWTQKTYKHTKATALSIHKTTIFLRAFWQRIHRWLKTESSSCSVAKTLLHLSFRCHARGLRWSLQGLWTTVEIFLTMIRDHSATISCSRLRAFLMGPRQGRTPMSKSQAISPAPNL